MTMVKVSKSKFTQHTRKRKNMVVVVTQLDNILEDGSDKNIFKVPVAQWRKWGYLGRRVFNEMYFMVDQSPEHFQHTKFPSQMAPKKIRDTTARNVARMAADSAEDIAEEMWNHFFKKQAIPRKKKNVTVAISTQPVVDELDDPDGL